MNWNNLLVGILAAGCLIATCAVLPSIGTCSSGPRMTKSMESLKGPDRQIRSA